MTQIVLNDVTYGYDENIVLHSISATLCESGLTCIIGPNGVGKSTLVKCINRILSPDEGEVTIDGKDVQEYSLQDLAKILGFVPVTGDDSFSLTVLDTVMMGRHPHEQIGSREKDIRLSFQALEMVGMETLAMRNAGELSAGQRQRVAIAKGIAQEPKILILDEPTANLDIRHQILVTKMLRELSNTIDLSVLMISHDLNIASKYADTIIVMSSPGIIYSMGPPSETITEDMIREVYGVESIVVEDCGRPHVILRDAM